MGKQLALEDVIAIQQLIGRYQWLVDDGLSEEWADLYTNDGVFTGGSTTSFQGRDQLKQVPLWVKNGWNGAMRHLAGSINVVRGENDDQAVARYYNFVTTWTGGEPKLHTFALSELQLVRLGGDWKIRVHKVNQLTEPQAPGTT